MVNGSIEHPCKNLVVIQSQELAGDLINSSEVAHHLNLSSVGNSDSCRVLWRRIQPCVGFVVYVTVEDYLTYVCHIEAV